MFRVAVVVSALLSMYPTMAAAQDASSVPQAPRERLEAVKESRPAALLPLYVSFGALQLFDVHSTSRALADGAVEGNPLMRGAAGSPAALLAVKSAGGAALIFASEKMWKKNRAASVVLMIAANSAMGWVVQHNYRAVR